MCLFGVEHWTKSLVGRVMRNTLNVRNLDNAQQALGFFEKRTDLAVGSRVR